MELRNPRLARNTLPSILLAVLLAGCASYKPPASPPMDFRPRAETQREGQVTVRAAVLSDDEARGVFVSKLGKHDIQPIWVEIDNQGDDEYLVMLLAIDPEYFSPSEAAWKSRGFGERKAEAKMEYFLEQHLPIIIEPRTKASGFVYTNHDPGAKAYAVELLGERAIHRFEFFQEVPGFEADYMAADPESHYEAGEIQDLDLVGLRAYLDGLPCCVLGGDKKTDGDPLNLVVVGFGDNVLATLVGRRWDLTETVRAGTAWKTAMSSVFGSYYRTSPVSPLYVFGRSQDVALQKARNSVDERNHLRLWLAPVTFEGTPVWVGQISRDIGIKLSSKTIVTHKIDPVVDEARIYVTLDLIASGFLNQVGHAKGVGETPPAAPRYNYTKDPYQTDGLRAVLFIGENAVGVDEIHWLDWERVPLDFE